jgi:N4-gp56 family major capsid protein
MSVPIEVWAKEIAENLYPTNSFYKGNCIDDSSEQKGKKVHVVQSGSVPAVTVNATYSGGGTPVERTDTDSDYDVDTYDFGPIVLLRADGSFNSYDKRASLMKDTYGSLNTAVADRIAYNWSPAGATNIIRTSGTARASYMSTQTGDRLAVAHKDILRLSTLMTANDIPDENRKLLIPAYLLEDLRLLPEFMDYQKLGYIQQLRDNIKGSIAGFDVYVRSRTTVYTNASTPVKVAPGTAAAATHNMSILGWHPDFVRMSEGGLSNGGIHIFENLNDAVHKGDVLSGQVFCGSKISRADQAGVYVIVEKAA